MLIFKKFVFLGFALLALNACTPNSDSSDPSPNSPPNKDKVDPANENDKKETSPIPTLIRSNYQKNEITTLCEAAIESAEKKLTLISQVPVGERNFDNTMLVFEDTLADLSDTTTPLTFMGYVSTNEELRSEGIDCEEQISQFYTEVFSRKEIYSVIKEIQGRNAEEQRLASETLKDFVKKGMHLSDEKLTQVKELSQKLNSLETKYQENLNNDTTSVEFTKEELTGVSIDFLNRLQKSNSGKFIVTTQTPDYIEVMENAVNSETRHKMLRTYENRQSEQNTQLLQSAIALRQQIANLMGYETWSDYKLDGRMAKDVPTVMNFLLSLKQKLFERNKADLAKFLNFKKQLDPASDHLDAWDIRYVDYQLKKRDYSLDQEKIKEYFPAATVLNGLFEVYSQILGVNYVPIKQETIWHDDVQLYEIRNKDDGSLKGYFFADLIPREGKYGHAAAFPLLSARKKGDSYSIPVAAIVANFTPPSGDKPSLLSHDDVETLFHEFGHIMHQTLTRAPYASLSGSNVSQDFVEAPSQMLENWAWDPEILSSLSGHYLDNSKKLPPALLNQMIAAKNFDQGYTYTRQLLFALFDMTIHSQNIPVDVTKLYHQMHLEIVGLPAVDESHFAASFGHLMGGYDAGYYGYLWSEVYAADMFTRFQQAPLKLRDTQVGLLYKTNILEKGNMTDPIELLKSFLGREPNADAFYKKF